MKTIFLTSLFNFVSCLWCICDAVGGVIYTFAEGEPVLGVASLDNHLYVLRGNKTSEQVEVYNIDSYQLLRCLTVPGFRGGGGIVACGYYRCAYIPDASHKSVHRLELPGAAVAQWPVDDVPFSLSLTVTHSVLVTCKVGSKIKRVQYRWSITA